MNIEMTAAFISSVAAIVSIISAIKSHMSAAELRREDKAAEELIAGELHFPNLVGSIDRNHVEAVLHVTMFNRSKKKKAYVNKVQAYTSSGKEVEINWSNQIDHLGNVLNPGKLIEIADSAELYLRATDSRRFDDIAIKIFHTFSKSALSLNFNYLSE